MTLLALLAVAVLAMILMVLSTKPPRRVPFGTNPRATWLDTTLVSDRGNRYRPELVDEDTLTIVPFPWYRRLWETLTRERRLPWRLR